MDGALMRVCIVSEGCYPYSSGGVSSWIHSMIQAFPNLEFVLVNIVSNREQRGKFKYELPGHVTEVYEVYLQDSDWSPRRGSSRLKLKEEEWRALRSLMLNENVEWDALFDIFQKRRFSLDRLLMGEDFLRIAVEVYQRRYSQIMFSDFLWTLRSMYIPLFLVMGSEIPEADVYHCVATGYAGIIGGMAAHFYGSRLLLSEHGIYTREREEELIRATWLDGLYKNIWIEQFKKMSTLIYRRAETVVSLYPHARELQLDLGCPEEKARVIPNGISVERFRNLPQKSGEELEKVYVGAVLRVTPIKDVKTMLRAFADAKTEAPNLKLWQMGSLTEDAAYAEECVELARTLELSEEDVEFTGEISVPEYLGRMDFTILTSISEGQPIAMLESFAAGKPVIATDVGNCRGLIYGEEGDDFGTAGILVHVMDQMEIANAMVELALHPQERKEMGERGRRRVAAWHRIEDMRRAYGELYEPDAVPSAGAEEPAEIAEIKEETAYGRDRCKA